MNKKDFYNTLAANYDEMIDFDKAIINRKKLLSAFISENDEVLDFGCGTGIDSIACSMLGAKVTAFDISEDMIEKAKQNAIEKNCSIEFLTNLENVGEKKFDKIFSLGNTFANIAPREVNDLSTRFENIVKPGGQILLQLVNYGSMPKTGEHVLNVKDTGTVTIKRYYNFGDKSSEFVISIVDNVDKETKEIRTEIFRHSAGYFSKLFNSSKGKVEFWGSLNGCSYEESGSKDLVCSIKF